MYYFFGYLLGFFLCLVLAGYVFWKKPRQPEAYLWTLFDLCVANWFLTRFITLHSISPEIAFYVQRVTYPGIMMINVVYLHFVLVLLKEKRFRLFLALGYSEVFILSIANLVSHLFVKEMRLWPTVGLVELGGPLFKIHFIFYLVYPSFGAWLLWSRRHAFDLFKNRQLHYLLLASMVGFLGGMTTFPMAFNYYFLPFGAPLVSLHVLIVTYAILKHHLMDIHVSIQRTLIYSIASASLIAIYVAALMIMTHLLEGHVGAPSLYSSAVVAAVIALVFHPLQVRLQRWIDHLFPREKIDPDLLREAAGGFAHEIKHPLAKISLPAELTLNDLQDVKNGQKDFDDVFNRASKNLEFIIEQAADAGRLVESIRELAMPNVAPLEAMELRECLEEVLRMERHQLENYGIALEIMWPAKCPLVLGRPRQVKIILLNLIRNAIEAMADAKGSSPHSLDIVAEQVDRWLELTLSDTGKGVPDSLRDKLFQPHFTTKGSRGTGLGLYLSHQLAQSCGGSLQSRAALKGGAQFCLRLPLASS